MIEVKRLVAGEAVLNEAAAVPRSPDRSEDGSQDHAQDEAPENEALENLVRQHSRLVYRIAYAALRSHPDAEDATQETFLRVLRYSHRLAAVEDPKTWLARIAWRGLPGAWRLTAASGVEASERFLSMILRGRKRPRWRRRSTRRCKGRRLQRGWNA
jgi:hypothetical protein